MTITQIWEVLSTSFWLIAVFLIPLFILQVWKMTRSKGTIKGLHLPSSSRFGGAILALACLGCVMFVYATTSGKKNPLENDGIYYKARNVWLKYPTALWQTMPVEICLFDSMPKDPRFGNEDGAKVLALPNYSNGMLLELKGVNQVTYFREVWIDLDHPWLINRVGKIHRFTNGANINKLIEHKKDSRKSGRHSDGIQIFRYTNNLKQGVSKIEYRQVEGPNGPTNRRLAQ